MDGGLLRIGTAGWAIPRDHAEAFPAEGSGLARYAARFSAAEINSSFHRPHRPSTYARWAETVPESFRFAAKMPKAITHERRLVDIEGPLDAFLGEIAALGPKLGPLLVQLPPSLACDTAVAYAFFGASRVVSRSRSPASRATRPGSPPRRTGSSPTTKWPVSPPTRPACRRLPNLAAGPASSIIACTGPRSCIVRPMSVRSWSVWPPGWAGRAAEAWCIFDNTASGAAAGNAVGLAAALEAPR
jgi:uncharacterized protein YecE (DUF72 family)